MAITTVGLSRSLQNESLSTSVVMGMSIMLVIARRELIQRQRCLNDHNDDARTLAGRTGNARRTANLIDGQDQQSDAPMSTASRRHRSDYTHNSL